jgi:hypothetical protein
MPKRSLQELLTIDEPAWPLVQSWLQESTNQVEVLPPSDPARGEALVVARVERGPVLAGKWRAPTFPAHRRRRGWGLLRS